MLAASLIHQLLDSSIRLTGPAYASAISDIRALTQRYRAGPEDCPFTDLWVIVASLLKLLPRYFLVIDSVDECEVDKEQCTHSPEPMNQFLSAIVELPKISPGRIVVFSRPEPSFIHRMSAFPQIAMDKGVVSPDIAEYVMLKIDMLRLSSVEKEAIVELVVSKAEGCFQYATTAVAWLKSAVHDDYITRLEEFPPELSEAYDQTLRLAARSMDHQELELRRKILSMVCGARRLLSAEELASFLHFRTGLYGPEEVITRLCSPLVCQIDGLVQFSHASVRDFLLDQSRILTGNSAKSVCISHRESESLLAFESLTTLLHDRYASLDRIGQVLRSNYKAATLSKDSPASATQGASLKNELSYDYASRYWHLHLTSVTSPDTGLLELLDRFLHGFQFVYWIEDWMKNFGDLTTSSVVLSSLENWASTLEEDKQRLIHDHLRAFFSEPYSKISGAYCEEQGQDKVLQWLVLMRLGYYYLNAGEMPACVSVRERAAQGLLDLLGLRNPLTLMARADMAYGYINQGRMKIAHDIYAEVVELQRQVIGTRDPEYFRTMLYKGQTEYYMCDFVASSQTQALSSAGLLKTTGPENFSYLASRLWYALPFVQLGQFATALEILQPVFKRRREKHGDSDKMATMFQVAIGDVLRKLEKGPECIVALKETLSARLGFWEFSHLLTLDVAIELLAAYRDFDYKEDAPKLLARIETEGQPRRLPARHFQTSHLKALLLSDGGEINRAIELLQTLLVETSRDRYNRALLWIVLDLAVLLRRRDGEGDKKQASSNFENIVCYNEYDTDPAEMPDTDSFATVDPPELLELAEQALKLVRTRNFDRAKQLLEQKNATWVREEDFWLWVGSPAADTAVLKPP